MHFEVQRFPLHLYQVLGNVMEMYFEFEKYICYKFV